jgi:chromosome segregation protein
VLNEEIERNRQKVSVLEREMDSLNRQLESAEQSLSSQRDEALQLRTQLEAAQKEVYDLRSEKENAGNRAEMATLRREDLEGRIKQINAELARLAQEEEVLAQRLAGETKAKEEQMNLFGDTDEAFNKQSQALAELQKQLNAAETDLSRHKQGLLVKDSAISRLRSNCTSLELDLKTYQVRHANLTEELQNLTNEHELIEKDLKELEHAREKRVAERATQEAKLSELRDKHQELTHQYRDLQKSIQEADRRKASLQAQIGVLEGLQAKFEGFSEGAKAILQGQLSDAVDESGISLFLKQLKVVDGFTRPVELLLGTAADGVFLRDAAVIRPLTRALNEKELGRASLLAMPPDNSAEVALPEKLPAGVAAASNVVSSEDGDIQSFLDTYLSGCLIADDLDAFLAHWQSMPGFTFRLAVTRSGEVIDPRGVILAGSTKNKKENSSFLSRQNQIKKFGKDLATLEDELERFRLQAEQAQGKLDNSDKRIEEQQQRLSETGTELTTLAAQRQGLERNREANERVRKAKSADLEKLESTKNESTSRLESARAELESTEAEIEAQKGRISEAEMQVEELRKERESKRESFDEARFEMAQKRQRLELLDRGLNELQQKSKETEETRIKRIEEVEQLENQIAQLQKESAQHQDTEKEIQARLDKVMVKLESDRTALKEVEKRIAVVEEGFAPKRESQQKMAAEHNKAEVALARQESRIQFIQEECERDYEREVASIDWKLELWKAGESLPERIRVDIEETTPEEMEALQERPDPTDEERASLDPVNWEEVEEEISSLRGRIQSMGPVNLVAIEEYKELKERHEFLRTQSEDLWKAKEQLLQAIDEINETSQKMFAETFTSIRENFHYTFDTLFGGGKADLKLVDAEDVLESGIEITAQPPGTRLRNLGLLSGGQKTMTAVALLFAIYMVKPSPFCVLDEIDAPLDDANIGRFTGMLERFLEFSQFLIITHNKRTISVADTIYGATMQEKGVSRLVSMRFNKATGKAEAAADEDAAAVPLA